MIFVTLGTQKFQFNRLLKIVDKYFDDGLIREEVLAQTGFSDYKPRNYRFYNFLDKEDYNAFIDKAQLLICHSGVGTIITAIKKRKPVIVYPRLAKFNEHIDDHQLDIAEAFSKKNYIVYCRENDNLIDLIKNIGNYKFDEYSSQTELILQYIREYLDK